jgi:hypothetical protein
MSRGKLVATTLAAVCSVGAQGMANTSRPDKPNQASSIQRVPIEVLNFLSGESARTPQVVYLSKPLEFDASAAISLSGIDLDAPRRISVHPAREMPAAELPLVPLPSPVWTGMAGLIGLGTIRMWKAIRKTLH